MTRAAKVLSPKSYLLRAMVAAVYCKMMKPLLGACTENGSSLLAVIKLGEDIGSITGEKNQKDRCFMQSKTKIINLKFFLGMSFTISHKLKYKFEVQN